MGKVFLITQLDIHKLFGDCILNIDYLTLYAGNLRNQ